MSLDPPTYLSSLQNNIRARPIPWEGAVRAGNITEDQLKRIKVVDKVRKEVRQKTVGNDLKTYATLLVGGSGGKSILESASRRTDIVQYILVLAADLINGIHISLCFNNKNMFSINGSLRYPRSRLASDSGARALPTLPSSPPTLLEPRGPDTSPRLRFLD